MNLYAFNLLCMVFDFVIMEKLYHVFEKRLFIVCLTIYQNLLPLFSPHQDAFRPRKQSESEEKYDMCKAIDRAMVIENVRLVKKTGGKTDFYHA